jgi:hypothetical protein
MPEHGVELSFAAAHGSSSHFLTCPASGAFLTTSSQHSQGRSSRGEGHWLRDLRPCNLGIAAAH